jgi:phage terminase large subunit-like protein
MNWVNSMTLNDLISKHPGSYLLQYMQECYSGKIIIGHELLQTFDLLITDFNNPDVKVDFVDAQKRIKFIETQCHHAEAPFAGKPFLLELFQKAFIEAIYCFWIFDSEINLWVRKYKDILFLVSRKNGKTPLISAICLSEFFCGDMGTKILCSSNDYSQADLAFQAIKNMLSQSPALEKVTRSNLKGVFFGNERHKKLHGKFSYANKGNITKISAKTGAKEGKNIRVALLDEVHELKDDSSVSPIRQALSTQNNPLYFELTTEGFINDGYLDNRLKEARQVLNGELDRPRWLIWLYTQDSESEIWQNEKSWVKSNPGLGVIKKWSYLREKIEEAKTNTATRAFVLAKDFNIKQNNAAAWLTEQDIDNPATFDMNDFKGCIAVGGVDLSKTGDLTSARIIMMRLGDSCKCTIQQYFIPESKLDNLPREDQTKFNQWVKDGLITLSPGFENDFHLVTQWFVNLWKSYGIRIYKIGYDRWSADYWAREMQDFGFDLVKISQGFGELSEPMKTLETDLKNNNLNYNNNPIDRWCLANTALAINKASEIMPIKVQDKQDKKIDGAVTLIMAYRIYLDNRAEFLANI